jgi:hypothetical protein
MEFKKTVNDLFKECRTFVNSYDSVYIINGTWKNNFNTSLKEMNEAISKLENSRTGKKFSFTKTEECINFLKALSVERKLTPKFSEFIKTFIFLVYNLNENLDKNETIRKKIQYLQRYCDNAMTLSENITLMRCLNKRVNEMKKWSPPSFRLSSHYYGLIKED